MQTPQLDVPTSSGIGTSPGPLGFGAIIITRNVTAVILLVHNGQGMLSKLQLHFRDRKQWKIAESLNYQPREGL